jgi:hypothetical protein
MKEKAVNLAHTTNDMLDEVSKHRRSSLNPAWRKKDIVAELVAKAHKREIKS